MGAWSADSKTHVATMSSGDFRHTERSVTVDAADDVRIELVAEDGDVTVLKESVKLLPGEIIDASVMSKRALVEFLEAQIADAKAQDVLPSVYLKATMMKVSRSEEHTSELQSLMRTTKAVFCLKKQNT